MADKTERPNLVFVGLIAKFEFRVGRCPTITRLAVPSSTTPIIASLTMFVIAGSVYLISLLIIHVLAPQLEPAQIDV